MATKKQYEKWYNNKIMITIKVNENINEDIKPILIIFVNAWLSYCKSKGISPEIED